MRDTGSGRIVKMKVIKASEYRRDRWKNGGGWTSEIASGQLSVGVAPASTDWHWRLSVADIEQDGPFSIFPGVDRILMLIDGAGMHLRFADGEAVAVTPSHSRIDFAGERALDCALVDGPTRDFNLMWRRDACHARLDVLPLRDAVEPLHGSLVIRVMFLQSGAVRVDGQRVVAGDTLLFGPSDAGPLDVAVMVEGVALLACIDPVSLIV